MLGVVCRKKHSASAEPSATSMKCSKLPASEVPEQQSAPCEEGAQTESKEVGAKPPDPVLGEAQGMDVLAECEVPQLPRLLPVVQLGEVVQSDQAAADASRIIVHLGAMQPLSTDTLHLVDSSSVVQVLNQPTYLLACTAGLDVPTISY
ncbi:hypothetical protein PR048_031669 [Dryococelus australis]|uniref:Uncharacterized protein n=1 Tax=Dryococelus australis TaxID=614101 RepID=A0ABQ9G5Y0_9NEOP|nr:hypothetical protein PR048_031669 [Dryococelus australis]